jgi:hypothetical protein
MPDPFTIRIFVPDGDPEGVRLIDRMNWTGLGIAFPRSRWMEVRQRSEFNRAGVYILVGYQEDDLPTIYTGKPTECEIALKATTRTRTFGTGE